MFRRGWSTVTATGKTIDDCLKSAMGVIPHNPRVCVALVSKSFPDYRAVTRQLASDVHAQFTIGCVVDHVPRFRHGISILTTHDERVVPFHVPDSPERHKVRSISVGRWGRKELKGDWDQFDSVSRPSQPLALPSTMQKMAGAPSLVFLATDNEPDPLLQALDHHFPQATKVGIVGASTPFVTGQPYALFCQNEVLGAGMVGFAAYDEAPTANVKISHPALEPLGETMTITRCRGNIILDLDQGGATGLLLALIQQGNNARIAKDQEFYLGIYPPGTKDPEQMSVSRVTSGDPSRGNMSVDTTADLQVGQIVQFMRRGPVTGINATVDTEEDVGIFGVVDKDHTIEVHPPKGYPESSQALRGVFGAASENGIIVGRPRLPSQILDVPYSVAKFPM